MNRRVLIILSIVFLTTLSAASGQSQPGRVGAVIFYLSGAQEVPEADNSFLGRFGIKFADDLSWADIDLTVFAANVTGAHLHCGVPGTNGPIVVNLLPGGLFGAPMDAAGSISKPSITNADILAKTPMQCRQPAPINNIASLHSAFLQGRIYVNVHTTAFPGGALRGQTHGNRI
jgi:hypothetical protein